LPQDNKIPERLFDDISDCDTAIKTAFYAVKQPCFVEHSSQEAGFRFSNPGALEFCLLKLARSTSSLFAMATLFQQGFIQEICILARSIIEQAWQAEFVALAHGEVADDQKAKNLIDKFFSDHRRTREIEIERTISRQEEINKLVGRDTDAAKILVDWTQLPEGMDATLADIPASKLMSDIYLMYSNYVHARYPEIMDLFSEPPIQINTSGFRNGPKIREMLEIIDMNIVGVANATKLVIVKFSLEEFVCHNSRVRAWYHRSNLNRQAFD